ncbi:MAG TPA: hypothetical protein PKV82_12085, partial [Anaerolineae bacterium]|nr:hypothetical protein [Anaerolineae bacterium]
PYLLTSSTNHDKINLFELSEVSLLILIAVHHCRAAAGIAVSFFIYLLMPHLQPNLSRKLAIFVNG